MRIMAYSLLWVMQGLSQIINRIISQALPSMSLLQLDLSSNQLEAFATNESESPTLAPSAETPRLKSEVFSSRLCQDAVLGGGGFIHTIQELV